MAEPDRNVIQEEDDEAPPINPRRRHATIAIGCLFALVILVLLVWFSATHTETEEDRGFLGINAVTPPPGAPSEARSLA